LSDATLIGVFSKRQAPRKIGCPRPFLSICCHP